MSKLTWDSLNAEDKATIKKTADEVGLAENRSRAWPRGSQRAIETLKKNGMEVTVLTPKEIEPFKAKTRPVYDKWTTEIGADLVRAAEKAVAAAK